MTKTTSTKTDATPREQRSIVGEKLSFAASEAYKLLRTNLAFSLPEKEDKCRIIGLTSSLSSEGKSTTSSNLAYSIAENNKKVLLIEADMRLPVLAKRRGIQSSPGLSNLIAGLSTIEETISESNLHSNLEMIVAGSVPPNPSELLGSDAMREIIETLSQRYDYIIVDLPPITEVSDALVVSPLLDGIVIVVRQDYSDRNSLEETMRQLKYSGANVLGFVLTRATTSMKYYYKNYGLFGRYGRYGSYGKYKRYGGYYSKYSKYNKYNRYNSYGGYSYSYSYAAAASYANAAKKAKEQAKSEEKK